MSHTSEQPIVVHPKVHGDPDRISAKNDNHARTRADDTTLRSAPAVERPAPPEAAPREPRERAQGLDAVRGVSLLGMNFTFAIPFAVLPAWMYHMQYPPPGGEHVPIPGLTWQDIIFPGFVFAMAAAIPIRGTQLLASGQSGMRITWDAVKRAALLYVFALIIAHVDPFYTQDYTTNGNLLSIAGFLTCFALFLRPRKEWDPRRIVWVRRVGWIAAAAILFIGPAVWGGSFSLLRRDHIIAAIAFTYVLSTIVWLLTRTQVITRIALAAAVAIAKLLAPLGGIFGAVLGRSVLPELYEPWYIELLLLGIPGLIAGDLLRVWMERENSLAATPEQSRRTAGLRTARLVTAVLLGFIIPVVLLVGLYQRWLPLTTFVTIGLVAVGVAVLAPLRAGDDRILARMGAWAGALIVIGMLLEPLEGGIKKDPQTLSFLILSAGLWFGLLLSMTILLDVVRGLARTIGSPIVVAGQNAMLAYVIFMLFYSDIAYLLGFGDILTATPAQAILRGVLVTGLVLVTLVLATRHRIVWRS